MDRDFIVWFLGLVRSAGIAELEYTVGDARLRLISGQPQRADACRSVPKPATTDVLQGHDKSSPTRHKIVSGATGLFYRSQSPGSKPFVEIGDIVNEGDTLGLLEAMKMLTPLESDRSGKVIEISVRDGAAITNGSLLFVLESLS